MHIKIACLFLFSNLSLLSQAVQSYELTGVKWPTATTTIEVQFTGDPDTPTSAGINWNAALATAATRWSPNFIFTVNHPVATTDPCTNNGQNDVGFHPNPCGIDPDGSGPASPGDNFGSTTLGVTLTSYNPVTDLIIESDIVFNSNKNWNIADPPAGKFSPHDIRRVAVHELGHLIGLGHSAATGAIMYPTIGDTENPETDDLAGLAAIYGATGATPGDEDGDNIVNIQDVIAIINIVLGSASAQGFGENCNANGGIDIQDVICTINVVLNN